MKIKCPGILTKIKHIFFVDDYQEEVSKQDKYPSCYKCRGYQDFNIRNYADVYNDDNDGKTILHFFRMPPSLSIVMKCKYNNCINSINKLNSILSNLEN